MKSDNEFDAEPVTDTLKKYAVKHLLSPPGLPAYNGAAEAGIGALKTRAHHESIRHDRPGEWGAHDVEAALLCANETARPWGELGPSPDQVWRGHLSITRRQREAFTATATEGEIRAREELGLLPNIELGRWDQAAVGRIAIGRALFAHGLVTVRRRRIPLPIFSRKVARIS